MRFLNADEIARGLSPLKPEAGGVKAGRILLREIQECMEQRHTFALESTLSGKTYIRLFREARERGYVLELHYLWLSNPALAIRRVRERVKKGGHHVSSVDIRRRHPRSILHLVEDYLPLADAWTVWNSECHPPKLLATSTANDVSYVRQLFGV